MFTTRYWKMFTKKKLKIRSVEAMESWSIKVVTPSKRGLWQNFRSKPQIFFRCPRLLHPHFFQFKKKIQDSCLDLSFSILSPICSIHLTFLYQTIGPCTSSKMACAACSKPSMARSNPPTLSCRRLSVQRTYPSIIPLQSIDTANRLQQEIQEKCHSTNGR